MTRVAIEGQRARVRAMSRATQPCQSSENARRALTKRVALIGASAVVLAACSSGPSPTPPPSTTPSSCTEGVSFDPADFHPCWLAANVNAGTPVSGGTLKLEGDEDVSAFLDPQGEYSPWGTTVERAFTRQLVSYPASTNLVISESIAPDVASVVPTAANGGISADGLTYTFHIKSGVMWNTSPARQVTSQDFKRGIERTCDPTLAMDGNPAYYTATIAGFLAFCTPFEAMDPASSPTARAAYINGHDVSGIQTPDSSTIVFTLTQPATDFLNILALPFASAAPVEDLSYVPASPSIPLYSASNPSYSDGPYQISNYVIAKDSSGDWVGQEIDLDHNPAWSQSSDAIRHDYVAKIDIKLDMTGSGVPEEVQDDLITGVADLEWDTQVPTQDVGTLTNPAWNHQYGAFPSPGNTKQYLLFNVLSPNNNGALGNVKVRQALEYAIDKVAINEISGGSLLNEPLNQVIGPGAEGYVPFNDYPTKGNQGDSSKCRSLLAAAGYPDGLTLKDSYRRQPPPSLGLPSGAVGLRQMRSDSQRRRRGRPFGPTDIGQMGHHHDRLDS